MNKIVCGIILKMKDVAALRFYETQFRRYCRNLNISGEEADGEAEYIKKWSRLYDKVEPWSYRLFSRYCGHSPEIIPEGIGCRFIEPIFCPERFRSFYCDKNTYSMYIRNECLPRTILYRMCGGEILNDKGIVAEELLVPSNITRLILKPSIDSCSGQGVMLFVREPDGWLAKGGEKLNLDFLKRYGDDFILQEAVEQHPAISRYCKTSVNTFRIATYRSVKDEQTHVLGALLRIGRDGEFVDNAHAGGRFVGIDIHSGKLGKYACSTDGKKIDVWNGVDFSAEEYTIPYWDRIVDFAQYIASTNPHMRLLALDICLDKNGNPKLIEYNCEGFGYWLYMSPL